jgi:archaellum component FlaF (FlaF/FlaG flagellin family)
MPYGDDITEGLVYTLSNPAGSTNYSATGEAYDVAIAGLPFFLLNSDDSPYRRVTAQYRKQQIDQSREPGEQTLTGWWLRSQSSFHYGQGIKFFEPIQDESLRFQYTESKGINVWTKGQATLLNSSESQHTVTGGIQTNGRPWQYARSIQWDKSSITYNGVLLSDEYDVDKIFPKITVSITNKALTTNVATLTTSAAHGLCIGMQIVITGVDATFNGEYRITSVPTTTTFTYAKTATNVASTPVSPAGTGVAEVIHFIDYNSGTDDPVFAICDDGVYAYWVTNQTSGGAKKIHVYKKLLTDDSSVSPTLMFNATGILVTNAVMEYTKERIVMCANDRVYEFASTATTLPTAVYAHNDPDHIFTSITSSGAAIYISGYSGIQSNIYKFTLSTAGAMPTLTSAITAAELPVGERVYKISYYLGNMAIGTSEGMRMADASQLDGSITYGALIFESTQPVYDFAFRDRYIWAASGVDGQVGLTRIDMGQPLGNLLFPYAWDLYDPADILGHHTTACAFLGDTNRLAFCNAGNGTDGTIYIQSASTLLAEGSLRTGYVRYNTLELKIFKLMQARVDTTNGGLNIDSIDYADNFFRIGTFAQEASVPEVNINYPQASQEYLGFQFTLTRSATDSSKGPLFTGYQIKALPAIPRQRLIQYPLSCFDHESDHFGVEVGYEGSAYVRMSQLENIENVGDTIRVEDFRTGESYIGLIEELDFRNATPSDKRFSGYGGTLLVTIRTV